MKRTVKLIALIGLVLALFLSQTAFAEENDVVKGIFDKLTAADSSYSQMKESNLQYMEGIEFRETLGEDSFTIEISGSDDMDGSWTFRKEGDFLTTSFPESDFTGGTMAVCVVQAAASYYELNTALVNSYISGMSVLGAESPEFTLSLDEATGTQTVGIYIAGPFEMKELDQMILDSDILNAYGYEPLTEEYVSMGFNYGKISILMNGSKDGVTLLLQEYGGLDDVALKSLLAVADYMKPAGGEAFTAEYTELKDAQGEGWTVKLNADEETVREIYPEPFEGYSNAVIRLGDQAAAE